MVEAKKKGGEEEEEKEDGAEKKMEEKRTRWGRRQRRKTQQRSWKKRKRRVPNEQESLITEARILCLVHLSFILFTELVLQCSVQSINHLFVQCIRTVYATPSLITFQLSFSRLFRCPRNNVQVCSYPSLCESFPFISSHSILSSLATIRRVNNQVL